MESVTAAVRSASLAGARSRPAGLVVVYGGARGARRVVGAAGPALAARARRRPLVAVPSSHHHEPLPSRAQEGGAVAVATQQADDTEVHANDDAAAAAAAAATSSPQLGKTVRVRFVLKKECTAGQSVCLVGGDPALGLWDPLNAFALEWAEESHSWILEKDLPANKVVEFKFLLQDSTGKLHWQDGPNRSFQTGETANTLVVFEDWDDVKNQKIAEEEGVASTGIEQTVVSNDSESRKDTVLEDELQADDNQVKEDESVVSKEDVKSSAVATDASVEIDWVKTSEANPQKSLLHEETEVHLDELLGKENMGNSSISSTDENYAEKTGGDILSEDGVPVENGLATAYEHDLLWGWKALQQLMMSLGFKMDTT